MDTLFPPLNLPLDADERAVKRAYAAVLKSTRPEDDPIAFQALVNARDRALDWVRRRGVPRQTDVDRGVPRQTAVDRGALAPADAAEVPAARLPDRPAEAGELPPIPALAPEASSAADQPFGWIAGPPPGSPE